MVHGDDGRLRVEPDRVRQLEGAVRKLDDRHVDAVGHEHPPSVMPLQTKSSFFRGVNVRRRRGRHPVAAAVLDRHLDPLPFPQPEHHVGGDLAAVLTGLWAVRREDLRDVRPVDRRLLDLRALRDHERERGCREQGEDDRRRQDPGHESPILRRRPCPLGAAPSPAQRPAQRTDTGRDLMARPACQTAMDTSGFTASWR